MADKKIPMGDDPLAWLAEGDDGDNASSTPAKKSRTRKTKSKDKEAEVKTEAELIEDSFAALAPQSAELAKRFYERLFEVYPQLSPLFEGVPITGQEKKLLASLVLLVQNLRKPDVLKDYLTGLGARHVHYGVTEDHYPMVAENLLTVMSEFAGELWTNDVEQAWGNTLNTVATIMLEAYQPVEADKMETTESNKSSSQEVAMMRSAINGSMTSMMMTDKKFNISYVNDATNIMLKPHEKILKKVRPKFNLKKLAGTNVDMLYEELSEQSEYLSDPTNLPFNTDVEIGSLHFNLNITSMMDDDGNHLGNTLEWTDTTETRAKEIEISSLQSAVDGATTALMMCNADRVITYANPAVMSLLGNRLGELRKAFPQLDLSKVVGTCIDDFHKNPSLQKGILSDLDNLPYRNQIQLLDIHFDLNATAIVDAEGNYMGNMVEWKDITDQVNAEEAIQGLITAAQAGQLKERIDTSNYDGFMKSIADGVNKIMDAVLAPVEETISISEGLAEGNLIQKMDEGYQGMFGDLADALNSTVSTLAETMENINDSSESISTAAGEISEGNIDLSQRTEQQASSLEETASSMEELTSTVRQNSDNARQANQLATSSREQAEKGGSVIKEAIDAMSAISASSKKVTDIIGVIDEIAFQTNLLALNAAVEAARAGEQGRGFAVVASEVRNLAQRSASAAKEIKELINDSGEKVKEGSMLVDESGRTLEEIVASSKKVGDIISEIAAAGAEQTQGIEQVNKAVTQMDEMTQQNAALVEEAAAASEALDEQGQGLKKLVGFFDIGHAPSAEPARPARSPASMKPATPAPRPKPAAKPRPAAPVSDDDEWDEF